MTREEQRLEESRRPRSPGSAGVPIFPNASGARCARITARTATPGTIFRTIMRAPARTAGAKTASRASATITSGICFALAFWNGQRSDLKERLFGLTVRKAITGRTSRNITTIWMHPHHSYMKALYKYPQGSFRTRNCWRETRRAREDPEFELIDTGVFNEDRYFDVFVEYAKATAKIS